jgi:predicted nucleic acid-binding protein
VSAPPLVAVIEVVGYSAVRRLTRRGRAARSFGLFGGGGDVPVDRATAELATALSSRYRLKATDATHLATAVGMGAGRFITNNQRDFPATITEVQVTYPADLADATPSEDADQAGP